VTAVDVLPVAMAKPVDRCDFCWHSRRNHPRDGACQLAGCGCPRYIAAREP
jgi:hypothetical protein